MVTKVPAAMVAADVATQAELDAEASTRSSADTTLTAAAAAAALKMVGDVVQEVNFISGALATGTTVVPVDDTIPQNTEGDQYMSLAITPTSAANKLSITVVVQLSSSAAGTLVAALFQDSTANALAVACDKTDLNDMHQVVFVHYMTAGTTSSTTFKVRCGNGTAGTTTFNGNSAARRFGGVMASSITITEIKV